MTEDSERGRTVSDWRDTGEPSIAVTNAIAEFTGQDVTEMPPIQSGIDAESIDRLLTAEPRPSGKPVRIAFTFQGVQVTVDSTGRIELSDADE